MKADGWLILRDSRINLVPFLVSSNSTSDCLLSLSSRDLTGTWALESLAKHNTGRQLLLEGEEGRGGGEIIPARNLGGVYKIGILELFWRPLKTNRAIWEVWRCINKLV